MPNSGDFNHFVRNPVNIGISRSIQDLSHSVKFSFNVGEVIPFEIFSVLPGDTISIDTSKVVRVQPMVTPVYDDLILDVYWFYIPNRLVWEHWVNFMGENTSSAWTEVTEYTIPQLRPPSGGWNAGTIADYIGIPIKIGPGEPGKVKSVSALPFRAYALTMDQWFRSEVVDNPIHVYKDDTTRTGVNTGVETTDCELGGKPFVAKKLADYFTTCLPQPQKGSPVNLFETGKIPVWPTNQMAVTPGNLPGDIAAEKFVSPTGASLNGSHVLYMATGSPTVAELASSSPTVSPSGTTYKYAPGNLWADLANATPFTINDLRTAFAIQRYMERQAISGSRYIEYIKAFYNVDSPDARLQRVEYLGGNRVPLNVSQVTQTSSTDSISPQGNVTGMSHTADYHSDFTKSFTEDGMVLGCAVVRYKNSYQQGVNRQWLQKTKYDFYNPVFANLGNQAVKLSEIYWDDGIDSDNLTFGYQECWSHYRYLPNRVAGEFRSNADTPLDMWHFADNYTNRPYLDNAWLSVDKTNVDRTLAVTSSVSNQLLADFYLDISAARPMPSYSIPGLIDHN